MVVVTQTILVVILLMQWFVSQINRRNRLRILIPWIRQVATCAIIRQEDADFGEMRFCESQTQNLLPSHGNTSAVQWKNLVTAKTIRIEQNIFWELLGMCPCYHAQRYT